MENATIPEPKIFFSYSRVDGEQYALKLANDLRRAGANVWIDQLDIELGKLWDLEVEKALNAANCILFITTEKSTTSNNVLNEVYYALEENKKVIPVVFHNCRIPFGLKRLQRIDFTTHYDEAFQRLLKALGLKGTEATASLPVEETKADEKPLKPDTSEQPDEERFWNDALRENNIPLFEEYLVLYPEGGHKAEANRRLEALRIKGNAAAAETNEMQVASAPHEKSDDKATTEEQPAIPMEEEVDRRPARKWLWGLVAGFAALVIFIIVQNKSGGDNNNSVALHDPSDTSSSMVKNASQVAGNASAEILKNEEPTDSASRSKEETVTENKKETRTTPGIKKTDDQSKTDGTGSSEPPVTEEDKTKVEEKYYTDYMRSGQNNMENRDYAAAAADFEKAIRTKRTAEALFFAGLAYGNLYNYPAALGYYNRAIAIGPVNWEYYNARGYAYYNTKDFAAASADYDRAIAMNPNSGLPYVNRGLAKRALNDVAGACADFMAAAKMGNGDGRNQYNLYCQKKPDNGQVFKAGKIKTTLIKRLYIISPAEKATIDYPRTTKVVWNEVPEATTYVLVVEMGNTQTFDQSPTYRPLASYTTAQTTYTFQGVGYQVHRYKVIAKKGESTIAETPWRYIAYSN